MKNILFNKICTLYTAVVLLVNCLCISGGATTASYNSVHDTKEQAIASLGTDTVFMTNNGWYFANGEKKKYPDAENCVYTDENGVAFVSADLISQCLDAEINVSGEIITVGEKTAYIGSGETSDGTLSASPTVADGILYVPAASFARIMLSKYAYEDGRGMVIISDTDRGYSNSVAAFDNLEPVDILYRYMQYERPSGDILYNAITSDSSNLDYPRMFIKKDEIYALKSKIDGNDDLKNAMYSHIVKCDNYIDTPVVEYEITDNLRLFNSCYTVRTRLLDLGVAYMLTGESKYADRMWLEMQNALSWSDWNVDKHFLDSGEIASGMAFAYDVLHDYLTEEQKSYFIERVDTLYLDAALRCFTDKLYCGAKNFRLTGSNWGAVCATGMLLMSLVLMDEEAGDSDLTEKCKFIAQNALQSLEYPIGMFYPDGAVRDGVGYWGYYMENISWSIKSLLNMCGSDYGLLSSPGYREAPDYLIYIQSKSGYYNHSSTNGTGPFWVHEAYLNAKMYNDTEKMALLDTGRQQLDISLSGLDILWFEPYDANISVQYPLDKYFKGEEITTLHGSRDETAAAFVGIRGGDINSQAHYDKGTFIYDIGGVRWFEDLGTEDYNIGGGYTGEGGKTLYRIRTEGHNGLVINPTAADPGQTPGGFASVVRYESKPKGAISVYDLKDVYRGNVIGYERGFYLGDNRKTLVVQDEVRLAKDNSGFYYFLHTKADITLSSDGKSAVLTQGGKKLKAEFECNASDWRLEFRNAENLFSENDREGEYSRDEYKKITLYGTASDEMTIGAKFSLLDDEAYSSLEVADIDSWTIPDGEILSKPLIDGLADSYFADETISFNAVLPKKFIKTRVMANGEEVCNFYCEENKSVYEVVLSSSSLYRGSNEIKVITEYEDGTRNTTKFVNIHINKKTNLLYKQNMSVLGVEGNMESASTARTAAGFNELTWERADSSGNIAVKTMTEKGRSSQNDDISLMFKNISGALTDINGFFGVYAAKNSGIMQVNFDVKTKGKYDYFAVSTINGGQFVIPRRAACEWSEISITIDNDSKTYKISVDGEISDGILKNDASLRFWGYPGTIDGFVKYDNLEILYYEPFEIGIKGYSAGDISVNIDSDIPESAHKLKLSANAHLSDVSGRLYRLNDNVHIGASFSDFNGNIYITPDEALKSGEYKAVLESVTNADALNLGTNVSVEFSVTDKLQFVLPESIAETDCNADLTAFDSNAESIRVYVDSTYVCDMTKTDYNGIFTAELSDMFGPKEIILAAIYADGSYESAKRNVNIKKASYSSFDSTTSGVKKDFNEMDTLFAGGESDGGKKFQLKYGWRPSGHVAAERIVGASGEVGDYAPKFTPNGNNPHIALLIDGLTGDANTFKNKNKELPKAGALVYDFDFMLTGSSAYIQLQGVPLWTNSLYMISDGKIAGTNVTLSQNKWVHINMVYDMTGGYEPGVGKWYVRVDDALVIDGVLSEAVGSTSYFNNVMIKCGQNDGKIPGYGFAIDNLTVYNSVADVYIESVSYAADNKNVETYNIIPENANAIKLKMSETVNVIDENITLYVDGIERTVSGIACDNNIVTIPISNLSSVAKVEIILKSTTGGISSEIRKTLYVMDNCSPYIILGDIDLTDKVFNAVFHKVSGFSEGASLWIICAVYDGNKLSEIKTSDEFIDGNKNNDGYLLKMPLSAGATQVKIMIWKSNTDIRPLKKELIYKLW